MEDIKQKENTILIYQTNDNQIKVLLEEEDIWLTQQQLVDLYQSSKSNVSEHIKHIFDEGELQENSVVRKFRITASDGKSYNVQHYNLDMIISLGYRIKSQIATKFRIWATERLKEYMIKGFSLNDEKLKNLGGGNYWKELLDRIRDIRSSEKVMYRQVLDLYATATDYDPKSETSVLFFKIVQNKLHYAAHGHTASEVIYYRVDSNKPFVGLTNFKGSQPTQAEAMIAKNYLSEQELKVLNNLVSAYFDLAELNAIEQREMKMENFVQELDSILSSTGRNILDNAGHISNEIVKEKALVEYKKYTAKTLSQVEENYLLTLKNLEKEVKKESRKIKK